MPAAKSCDALRLVLKAEKSMSQDNAVAVSAPVEYKLARSCLLRQQHHAVGLDLGSMTPSCTAE